MMIRFLMQKKQCFSEDNYITLKDLAVITSLIPSIISLSTRYKQHYFDSLLTLCVLLMSMLLCSQYYIMNLVNGLLPHANNM